MPADSPLVTFAERYGTPFLVGDLVIRPDARVLQVALPFGGLIWNSPLRLAITHKDGTTYELPIVDQTRRTQIAAAGAGALAALLLWLLVRR